MNKRKPWEAFQRIQARTNRFTKHIRIIKPTEDLPDMTSEEKKNLENTYRVASNLQALLSDKDVMVPTKYAMAIVESQNMVGALVADIKKNLEASSPLIVPATAMPTEPVAPVVPDA